MNPKKYELKLKDYSFKKLPYIKVKMKWKNRKKVKNVFSVVFELDPTFINENSSPDNIDNWDSLKHMMLISALEEEFDIQFSDRKC